MNELVETALDALGTQEALAPISRVLLVVERSGAQPGVVDSEVRELSEGMELAIGRTGEAKDLVTNNCQEPDGKTPDVSDFELICGETFNREK